MKSIRIVTFLTLLNSMWGLHAMQPAQSEIKDGAARVRVAAESKQAIAAQALVKDREKLLYDSLPMLPAVLIQLCNDYYVGSLQDPQSFSVCGLEKVGIINGEQICALFSYKNRVIAVTLDKDNKLFLYDVTDTHNIGKYRNLENNTVQQGPFFKVHYGNGKLAAGCKIWDIETGKLVQEFPTEILGLSADGTKICREFEAEKQIGIYDLTKKTKLQSIACNFYRCCCAHGLLAVMEKYYDPVLYNTWSYKVSLYNLNNPEKPFFVNRLGTVSPNIYIIDSHHVRLKSQPGIASKIIGIDGRIQPFRISESLVHEVAELFIKEEEDLEDVDSCIAHIVQMPNKNIYFTRAESYGSDLRHVLYVMDMQRIYSLGCFDQVYIKSLQNLLERLASCQFKEDQYMCTDEDFKILEQLRDFDPIMHHNVIRFFNVLI